MNIGLSFSGIMEFFLQERRKRKKEESVPQVLLQASIFPRGTPVSKIVEYLAVNGKGPVGIEFGRAFGAMERGASAKEALEGMAKRNSGKFFSEAIEMLLVAEESGAEMNSAFREKAEEVIEVQSIMKERLSMLSIQRATLLLGGGIIVPFILGLLSGMALSFSSTEFLQIMGGNIVERMELLEAAVFSNQAFVIEYAIISSLFLSFIEGRPRKVFLYSAFLVPLGAASFHAAMSIPII